MSMLVIKLKGLWPFGPIFAKELRQMARRKRSYALRSAYLGLLLFVLFVCWVAMNQSYTYMGGDRQMSVVMLAQRQAEMGQVFFSTFAMFSVVTMHLIGPVLTSTAIGSERLRRTLDVLLMTPLTAWQIVGGKLSSRMLTALTLIGLTLPVLAIVRLLGGVEIADLFGSLSLSAATALASAAIGLWLSCYLQRAWAVILLAYLVQGALYFVLPLLVGLFYAVYMRQVGYGSMQSTWLDPQTLLQIFCASHPVYTTAIATIGRGAGMGVTWWPAVAGQLGLALVLTLLAARGVRRHARREAGGAGAAGLATPLAPAIQPVQPIEAIDLDAPTLVPAGDAAQAAAAPVPPPLPGAPVSLAYQTPRGFDRPLRTGRPVTDRPILWHELRRPLLPRSWQRVLATTITLTLLGLSYLGFAGIGALDETDLQIGYAFVFHGLIFLIVIVLSATSIATEKESDTWTLLIATPITGGRLVLGKFIGVLRRLMWPTILMVGHLAAFLVTGVLGPLGVFIALWTIATFTLPWVATGLYVSLLCRRVTTAVVLNLLLPVIAYGLVPMVLLVADGLLHRRDRWPELTLHYLPWWYLGEGINAYGGWHWSWNRHVYIAGTRYSIDEFVMQLVVVGLLHVGVTLGLLAWMSRRFDRTVGRARG